MDIGRKVPPAYSRAGDFARSFNGRRDDARGIETLQRKYGLKFPASAWWRKDSRDPFDSPSLVPRSGSLDCMTNNGLPTVSSKLDLFMTEELETKEAAYEVYRL